MPIPESQLETWSHQGAVTNSQRTHKSIRHALDKYSWPLGIEYEVYLQGSYRNSTNIYGDSDVDIVVQLNSAFRSNLTDADKSRFGFVKADYGWHEFREDVRMALIQHFGSEKVSEGKKTLKVQTSYLPADVVVAVLYRKYPDYPNFAEIYTEGMTFYVPSESRWVINYPKLHYQNGTKKNKVANGLYKPTIRMFKNARNYAIRKGFLNENTVPSYFLECFLYNVPSVIFSANFQTTYSGILGWFIENVPNWMNFVAQNEQLKLFGNSPEQWDQLMAAEFLIALQSIWENYER